MELSTKPQHQTKLEKAIGSTDQYINRLIKSPESIINKTFVKMFEALGYDITLTYTPGATDAKPDLDELLKQR